MIVFLILIVILALVLQKVLLGKDLDLIEADHRPDIQVAEPGQPFHVEITLKNKSRRVIPFLRVCEDFEAGVDPVGYEVPRDSRDVCHVGFTTWLRPRQSLKRAIPVTAASRGRYVLRQFHLYSGDFLGLQEQSATCGRFHEVVVAPREIEMERLNDMFGGFMGEVSVNRFIMEDPVLTLGYREYTGREPMKTISWAQSARTGALMVKKYDYTLEPTVSVLLNVETNVADAEPLLETCFSMARTVCAMLERKGVKYSFASNAILGGAPADPGATGEGLGRHHFMGILEHLGRATYAYNVSMSKMLEKESNRGAAAGCILITPGGDGESIHAINRLREAAGGNLLVLRASEVASW